MKELRKPKILLMDFDRTLTYLYRDVNKLFVLADLVVDVYKEYMPINIDVCNRDGYYVWHELHNIAIDVLEPKESEEINSKAEKLVTEYEMGIIKEIGLFEGVTEAIRALNEKGYILGAVSSNGTEVLEYIFGSVGILDCFCYVKGRPIPFSPLLLKPNPYPIVCAIEQLSSLGEEVWYIGDDIVDIVSAQKAKVKAIGVASGRHSKDILIEAGADACFESFVQMVNSGVL